jgi:hypothetical protein
VRPARLQDGAKSFALPRPAAEARALLPPRDRSARRGSFALCFFLCHFLSSLCVRAGRLFRSAPSKPIRPRCHRIVRCVRTSTAARRLPSPFGFCFRPSQTPRSCSFVHDLHSTLPSGTRFAGIPAPGGLRSSAFFGLLPQDELGSPSIKCSPCLGSCPVSLFGCPNYEGRKWR